MHGAIPPLLHVEEDVKGVPPQSQGMDTPREAPVKSPGSRQRDQGWGLGRLPS